MIKTNLGLEVSARLFEALRNNVSVQMSKSVKALIFREMGHDFIECCKDKRVTSQRIVVSR